MDKILSVSQVLLPILPWLFFLFVVLNADYFQKHFNNLPERVKSKMEQRRPVLVMGVAIGIILFSIALFIEYVKSEHGINSLSGNIFTLICVVFFVILGLGFFIWVGVLPRREIFLIVGVVFASISAIMTQPLLRLITGFCLFLTLLLGVYWEIHRAKINSDLKIVLKVILIVWGAVFIRKIIRVLTVLIGP